MVVCLGSHHRFQPPQFRPDAHTLRIVALGAVGSTLLLCISATEQHEETDDEGTSKGESLAIGQEVCEFSNGTAAESKKD